jgi:energy-converting hydrogenase Eha subunit F
VYVAYGVIALAASATQVGYSSIELGQPAWLTVTLAVVAFLAVPVSSLAATNVNRAKEQPQPRGQIVSNTPLADRGGWDNADQN